MKTHLEAALTRQRGRPVRYERQCTMVSNLYSTALLLFLCVQQALEGRGPKLGLPSASLATRSLLTAPLQSASEERYSAARKAHAVDMPCNPPDIHPACTCSGGAPAHSKKRAGLTWCVGWLLVVVCLGGDSLLLATAAASLLDSLTGESC